MRDRRRLLIGLLLIGAMAAAAVVVLNGRTTASADETRTEEQTAAPAETVSVTRRDLREDLSLQGSLSHGDSRQLPIEADGIVTASPEQDTVLQPGDEAIRVDNRPVTLAEGGVPLYRELRGVNGNERDEANDRIGLQEGPDVEQLQRFLIDAGFDDDERLEVDAIFGLTTERAVKAWQKDVGHPATGRIDRSQLVFIDEPVRVESSPLVGSRFDEIRVGMVRPIVTLEVSNRQRPFFQEGTAVSIETDAGVAEGQVTGLKRTTGPDGSTRHSVEIEFSGSGVPTDAETAEVTSTRIIAENVTTVPVRALVALSEGGWALQVESPDGAQLTSVQLGDVVDGIAEITGLDEGTAVVVPS
jgi:peptidoglycan hydrolase-like protein with peptidoglycan-binding domain